MHFHHQDLRDQLRATSAGRAGKTSDMASKASDSASDSCCMANWKLYHRICTQTYNIEYSNCSHLHGKLEAALSNLHADIQALSKEFLICRQTTSRQQQSYTYCFLLKYKDNLCWLYTPAHGDCSSCWCCILVIASNLQFSL